MLPTEKDKYWLSLFVFFVHFLEPEPKACHPEEETAANKDRSQLGAFLLQVCLAFWLNIWIFPFASHLPNQLLCHSKIPARSRTVQPHLEPEDEGGAAGRSGGRDACLQCGPWAWQCQRHLLEPPGVWGLCALCLDMYVMHERPDKINGKIF